MSKTQSISDTDFKIKYDGELHQIDATVLINNLIHTTSIIQEINKELNSGKKIDVKIKALEKGSFLVHIDLVETVFDSLKDLLTRENLETSGAIIGGLVGLIELKKFLKGSEAKSKKVEGNRVKIENEKGQVIYIENFVNNIYENNTIVKDALSQSFETLENDNSITAYEITDRNEKPLVRVEKEDFEYLSLKSERILNDEKLLTQSANLNIVKLSFDQKLKWEFYFKGNRITAKVEDPNFQKRIDNGESFAKGDMLEVELEIKQKYDSTVNTYINKSYKINKILNHIKREDPPKLDFNNTNS